VSALARILPGERVHFAGAYWTREKLDVLKALRDQGKSASIIAAEIGTTRSSVLGAAKRARDKGDDAFEWSAVKGSETKDGRSLIAPTSPRWRPRVVASTPMPLPTPFPSLPLFEAALSVSESRRVSLVDLERDECRWLDDDDTYCGAPVLRGSSYCCGHHALVYRGRGK